MPCESVICYVFLIRSLVSRVWLLWPHGLYIACQAPLSMGSSRQEYWSGLPFPSPGDLPHPGIEPVSPALQVDSLPLSPGGKPVNSAIYCICLKYLRQRGWERVVYFLFEWTFSFLMWSIILRNKIRNVNCSERVEMLFYQATVLLIREKKKCVCVWCPPDIFTLFLLELEFNF